MSTNYKSTWTLEDARSLCIAIEAICPKYGCHVALTGGTLYKDGERKDCDILFYRIRQVEQIDVDGLLRALDSMGICVLAEHGWMRKALYRGMGIDIFFPEHDDKGGDYKREEAP